MHNEKSSSTNWANWDTFAKGRLSKYLSAVLGMHTCRELCGVNWKLSELEFLVESSFHLSFLLATLIMSFLLYRLSDLAIFHLIRVIILGNQNDLHLAKFGPETSHCFPIWIVASESLHHDAKKPFFSHSNDLNRWGNDKFSCGASVTRISLVDVLG